jgi:ABC-type glutathione transport system ATPase component
MTVAASSIRAWSLWIPTTKFGVSMLSVEGVSSEFRQGWRGRPVWVLDGVNLSIRQGETCGLFGPSGSGKTTLARMIVGLIRPSSGRILFENSDMCRLSGRSLRDYRRQVQLVFQNPQLSLDPRQTVLDAMAEPLKAHGRAQTRQHLYDRIESMLAECGLTDDILSRRPHQISGGQAQRVALARALSLEPRLLIGDEPTSMLDVSVQAQVMEILKRWRENRGLAVLLISHDADLMRAFCRRTAILEAGRIVADGDPLTILPRDLSPLTPEVQENAKCFKS